jgi:hypothetical protein
MISPFYNASPMGTPLHARKLLRAVFGDSMAHVDQQASEAVVHHS